MFGHVSLWERHVHEISNKIKQSQKWKKYKIEDNFNIQKLKKYILDCEKIRDLWTKNLKSRSFEII